MCNVWIYLLDSSGLDNEKHNSKKQNRVRWNFTSKLEDLDFADDIALMSSCYTHMQTETRQLNQFVARTGLK